MPITFDAERSKKKKARKKKPNAKNVLAKDQFCNYFQN